MTDISIIYVILALVFLYLIIMVPVNINKTRIYTRNMMNEMEAIHKTLQDISKGLTGDVLTNLKHFGATQKDVPYVQCSWCKKSVPENKIERFEDVNLCPACTAMGGKKAMVNRL